MGGPALINDEFIEEFDNFYICYFFQMEENKKIEYASTEHYYQSHKMLKPESRQITREARTAKESYLFGNMFPLRKGWEEMKNDVMFEANKLKFEQNEKLKRLLLNTGDYDIHFPYSDEYWSSVSGLILMALRAYFKDDLDTFTRYAVQLNLKIEKYIKNE